MLVDTTSPKLTPQQLAERRVREKEDAAAAWLEYLAEPDLQRKKMAQQRAARLARKNRLPVRAKKAKAKQAR
jgi:hypothetical protein